MPERIGILGGTFDPPHVAHLALAVQARYQFRLDRVLLVVANDPWQKNGSREISPAACRLDMVRAALDDVEGIEASSLEVDRGGESYTADTLAALRTAGDIRTAGETHERELFLIIGSDLVTQLHTWKRWEEVASSCTLAIGRRPGPPAGAPAPPWRSVEIRLPALDISSTELRAMVAEGRPVDFLVPRGAIRAMIGHGLYRRR